MRSEVFFETVLAEIESYGFRIVGRDFNRPWGGFLVIDESQVREFCHKFFTGMNEESLYAGGKLSPKILIVEAGARLSWQYHERRAEVWRVFRGNVGVIRSQNDLEGNVVEATKGMTIRIQQGERHRLIGLSDYGIVSEIWQHTGKVYSDEEDIIRLQDDFNRS